MTEDAPEGAMPEMSGSDPLKVDVGTAKPRRRREPMPDALKKRAAAAGSRHDKRYPAPTVDVVKAEHGWSFESPFRSADEENWWRLLGEAFGTRTKTVVGVFMGQVAGLVGTYRDAEGVHRPDEPELQAALSIVAAMKPRNEAEAAQAAQAFALHVVAMRTGQNIASVKGHIDPRQSLALANLVKAYAGVMASMRQRGRSRSTRQTIVVKKDVRIFNDNRRVTLGGGDLAGAEQPDGPDGNTRARPSGNEAHEGRTRALEDGQALLSSPEVREAVQGTSYQGPECLPGTRRARRGS